jgi:hypothetical protein
MAQKFQAGFRLPNQAEALGTLREAGLVLGGSIGGSLLASVLKSSNANLWVLLGGLAGAITVPHSSARKVLLGASVGSATRLIGTQLSGLPPNSALAQEIRSTLRKVKDTVQGLFGTPTPAAAPNPYQAFYQQMAEDVPFEDVPAEPSSI